MNFSLLFIGISHIACKKAITIAASRRDRNELNDVMMRLQCWQEHSADSLVAYVCVSARLFLFSSLCRSTIRFSPSIQK